MYVGNDSFGSHITSQSGKKSIVMLLDAPRAYTTIVKIITDWCQKDLILMKLLMELTLIQI